ncbi:hypothetical protein FACS189444_5280 [Spirochaetia bacterium]|nr:hypothetical protein FACS189444_5280 [Spirochaetia bacterium]
MATEKELLDQLKSYVDQFNRDDDELYINHIPNSAAYEWMAAHVPLITIPDKELEAVYYFRWWTFRKHIKKTETGFIISEFLPPVGWAGKYNSISCASGHHLTEGRWLRGEEAIDSYIRYWYQESANLNDYSHWLDYSVYELCVQRGDFSLGIDNLGNMIKWYTLREERNFREDVGLFWGRCDRDGQEYAVSGDGFRLPLNCYMAANAKAIAEIALRAGRREAAEQFADKHGGIIRNIEKLLWSEKDHFYLNIHCPEKDGAVDLNRSDSRFKAKELWGYTPWYFGLAPKGREGAFDYLTKSDCFSAQYGLTTAERSHPRYGCFYTGQELNNWRASRDERPAGSKGHECLWNGPVWPFATSQALTALAHSNRKDDGLFYRLLKQYASSHTRESRYWIDEVQHPDTGDWISRTRLKSWSDTGGWDEGKGGVERGKDYNHSTFCDLVISGLFGLRPSDAVLTTRPLIPKDWKYAALYHIPFGGKRFSIQYGGETVSIIPE